MNIRWFISQKRPHEASPSEDDIDKGTPEDLPQVTNECSSLSSSQPGDATRHDLLPTPPHSKKQQLSSSEQRKQYKAKLSYKREWEKKYSWVTCKDASKGMFCTIWGHPTAGSRGGWTNKGVTDWSHATELLRAHGESWCHRDVAATASMSQQAECRKSVLELQRSAAAKVAACRTKEES